MLLSGPHGRPDLLVSIASVENKKGEPLTLLRELKRRNVHRVGAAYLVVAWLLVQVAATILPAFGLGPDAVRVVIVVLAAGLLPALAFAWAFEVTPDGLKLERDVDRADSITAQTGRKLDRAIMIVLASAVGLFAFDKFVLDPVRDRSRVESARAAVRSDLLRRGSVGRSLVVLPFANMSPDPEQEYFSDGMAEELLNLLARLPQLRVISRTSAFSYKGKDIRTRQIAEELGISHILEGSVRRSGSRLRVTAKLIDAHSEANLWSQTWERSAGDVFAIQDEIAGAVVEKLRITLLGPTPTVEATDPEAYALTLDARQRGRLYTRQGMDESVELFRKAVAIDPGYAPAWEGLAVIYSMQADLGLWDRDERYRLAREAVNAALAIAPDSPVAHGRLGWIATRYDDDFAAAARHFERAFASGAAPPTVYGDASSLAQTLGRMELAIALNEYYLAHDPRSAIGQHNMGHMYLLAGRWDDAIASFRTALTLSPDRIATQYYIGVALLLKGEPEAALAAIHQEQSEPHRLIGLPMALHALGRHVESEAALAELIEKYGKDAAYNIGYVQAFRGQSDSAFQWLEREYEISGSRGWHDVAVDPQFANLHGDPRWVPFLTRVGSSPRQLARVRFDPVVPAPTAGRGESPSRGEAPAIR